MPLNLSSNCPPIWRTTIQSEPFENYKSFINAYISKLITDHSK
jgi:hypothetical protein